MEVLEFKGGDSGIGLLARNGNRGPEEDLVEAFKSYVPECFRWRAGNVALFQEPQIETGFPDLVVVQYMPGLLSRWPAARSDLRSIDLKVMHHLVNVKGADANELTTALGIDARGLLAALERLIDAKMVSRRRAKWMPQPLSTLFAIRSIVAIEAKIKNWSEAFKQARLDQWFASEAFVLSPIDTPRQKAVDRSESTGVGILLLNGSGVRRFRPAMKHGIPASYGSWLFNEWIGRRLQRASWGHRDA